MPVIASSSSSASSTHDPTPPVQDSMGRTESPPPAYSSAGQPNNALLHQLNSKMALPQTQDDGAMRSTTVAVKPTPESMGITFPQAANEIDASVVKLLPDIPPAKSRPLYETKAAVIAFALSKRHTHNGTAPTAEPTTRPFSSFLELN
ncbi:hypothetical protein FRC17_008745 [Serendipita sp. 399]|nr:hypothetical protein FRC17_008745 [Serendipita sp. 399]